MTPFTPDQVGHVNANAVGEYPPGVLLVVGPFELRHRRTGWNHLPGPDGGHFLALDSHGEPLYPLLHITQADVDRAFVTEEAEADAPLVVTS